MKFAVSLVLGVAAVVLLGQTDSPSDEAEQGPVLRISVNLVQVDAVVTDSHGRQVTDLSASDFELFQDGRPQKLTACTYVRTAEPPAPDGGRTSRPERAIARQPLAPRLQAPQVRRTVVLIVDDLGLSFESIARVRTAMRTFVDEQMQPGDLVAIVRTRGGIGALEQFTTDKRILYAAIDRVRWFAPSHRLGAFEPIGYDARPNASTQTISGGPGGSRQLNGQKQDQRRLPQQQSAYFFGGTLGTVNFVIDALRALPGRKAAILFSDGVPALQQRAGQIRDELQHLADRANRAAVVLYTIDSRGLQYFGLTAADNTNNLTVPELAAVAPFREREFLASEDGLDYLARQTGGMFLRDNNRLSKGILQALSDMSGYYLLGYKPDESSFDPRSGRPRFHKVEVKVRRAGLHVRSRTGYIGLPDQPPVPVTRSGPELLNAALHSPFDAADLNLRLTPLFSEDPKTGAAIRILVEVDGRDLQYAEQPDGMHLLSLDLGAVLIGEHGAVAGSKARTSVIRLSEAEFQRAQTGGLVFKLNVSLPRPGAYQIRAALRDAQSGKIGSARQFIETPDFAHHRLALSGIVINGPHARASDTELESAGRNYEISSPGTEAMRIFHPGEMVSFGYGVFDAFAAPGTGRPNLETTFTLYRDGLPVYTSPITPVNARPVRPGVFVVSGTLQLGQSLDPGDYIFEAIAREPISRRGNDIAAQQIDLEIQR